jgi:hypothetical protein
MTKQHAQARSTALLAALVMMATASSVSPAWVNVTANLAGHASACGNTFCLFSVPHRAKVIAGLCGSQGLFATTDGGTSWQAMGASTGWVDPQYVLFDKDNPDIFWQTGIHGGQMHQTTDGGASFTVFSGGGNGDGLGVDFTDPHRKTIVCGSHESSGVKKSTDGGATWTDITAGTSGWTNFPVVIDAQTYVEGGTNGAGIFRTTDGGGSWTKVSAVSPSWDPLLASTGSIYFAAGNQAVVRSDDRGATWISMTKPGDGNGYYTPVEMPDHSIVAIGQGKLVQCSDGSTWKTIVATLPSNGMTLGNIAYDSAGQAFFMAYWDCNATVSASALWKFDYAATTATSHTYGAKFSSLVSKRNLAITAGENGSRSLTPLTGRWFSIDGRAMPAGERHVGRIAIVTAE